MRRVDSAAHRVAGAAANTFPSAVSAPLATSSLFVVQG